jgi:NAD(P)H dehydrogenase (quinone)
MNVLIVHAHPEPRSFVSALKDAAFIELTDSGHTVRVADLCAIGFDPRLTRADFGAPADDAYFTPQREQQHACEAGTLSAEIREHLDALFWADLVIFTFPLWWFSVPAILKGWIDRVLVMGEVYGGGKVHETGGLAGRRALLAFATGGPAASYAPGGRNGTLTALLAPVQWGTLHFSGFGVLAPFVVNGPVRASDDDRAAVLAAWRERLRAIEHEAPVAIAPPGA